MIAAVFAGCASRAENRRARRIAASSPAEPSEAAGPRFAQGGPDADDYGASDGYPIGARGACQRVAFLVGCQSHFDQVYEGRLVRRATTPSSLAAPRPRNRQFGTSIRARPSRLTTTLARNPPPASSSLVVYTILVERYQYARHDRHRFTSWSMAKTVTAMLIGIAIAEGHIRSVDDPAAAYVPALAGTEYGRNLVCGICFRCPQVCVSSRSTGKTTTCRGSSWTRFDRLVPAASKQ